MQKDIVFQNFICPKFHPIQMNFQTFKTPFLKFRSLSTKIKSALQPTLKSLSLFLFTNNNFLKLFDYKFYIFRLVSVLVKEKIIFCLNL